MDLCQVESYKQFATDIGPWYSEYVFIMMEVETFKHDNFRRRNIDGFHYGIELCRFLLRLLGGWPDPYIEKKWWSSIHPLMVASTMIFFTTISQIVQMIRYLGDMNYVIEVSVNCCIPVSIAMVKLVSVWYHRDALRVLVLQIMEDWERVRGPREMKFMMRSARISRLFSMGCFFLNKITLTAQFFVNFGPILKVAKTHDNDEWPLYFDGTFPYSTRKHPNYEFTIIGQWLSNIFAALSFESTDSFFVFLVFHLIAQLSILKIMIYELPGKSQNKDEFLKKYDEIHELHNRLWRYLLVIENSFNVMFFIQMIPCIFVLCTQGYMLIMITDEESISMFDLIFMIQFLLLFLLTIYTYCFVAESLQQKSLEISFAVYDSDWTSLPADQAKLLIPIILRAQHPFEVTAGKFAALSLRLFSKILKSSAGYLSMLLAVKDRLAAENDS